MEDYLEGFRNSWSKATPRVIELLRAGDCTRGVLLVAKDGFANEAATELAGHLVKSVIAFHGQKESEWKEAIRFLRDRSFQEDAFVKLPEYPGVLVPDLERQPKWMWHCLKGLFERSVAPCLIVGATSDLDEIPGWLSSHFHKLSRSD